MFLRADQTSDGVKFCVLSRAGGGGAVAAKTEKSLVVGVWGKDVEMSNKKTQNTGDCEKNVCNVANSLKAAGY